MLKFAILKFIQGKENSVVVLEYDIQQVEDRLVARTMDGLDRKVTSSMLGMRKLTKDSWGESEITAAVRGAFISIVKELKEQTVGVV